ncbi:penicillin-binding protein 2 [Seohaeicola sp. SP36]|jgi:cell division protein FtsI (penicillin-binding protein 3)|uniref:peptidoglycan D,D-transpeptidase FtsI family protein n=1 Tax=unclassified Seohaeicola TaxID=2641111 RepID=UPI00237A2865|nr:MULTISPECIES: penicillin-binding protein 2 [unclassified Seohaeicola]MDD9707567.1 penicillin-binding protein 2 [Seohaeicola sp. 4SK31]MDD9735808.1 penicillin-binding protein 2 [Seohaeicola sp. SP36]MDF1709435.1 penicillin-binding protein 2 [Paracoccaceae bacterium]
MIRTPLRPLARVLEARAKGENPDAIERENLRLRHEEMRDRARQRAEGRLLMLGVFFVCAFAMVGGRMALLAASEPSEPRASAAGAEIQALRADIVDRQGRILATNLETFSLYAQPPLMVDPEHAATELARIFPDLDRDRLIRDFTGTRKFLWVKRRLSPEQQQAVHDIGDPGLLFGPRDMRLYPNGTLAAHVLGGAGFGREGVHAAEVIGVAGVERQFDEQLRDPARAGQPLELSLDLTIQAATEEVLAGGMRLLNAKGAAAVLMDVHTGEVISIASLPDFDPNDRPVAPTQGRPDDSPLFNRVVQGVYELGSTFKIFTVAQALEMGMVTPDTIINTKSPMTWGRHRISDFRNYGPELTVSKVIEKSSNVGTARIAIDIGAERQRAFLGQLGLLETTKFEMVEARGGKPLLPPRWSELSTMTISYGHGISATPLHLAAAYATMVNGGTKVEPTLLKQNGPQFGPRVISEKTSEQLRRMLRLTVSQGTASFGDVPGYAVGGKTGSADKPRIDGRGYETDKVLATFAATFPAHDPKYVLIVTLDEAVETSGSEPRRTAGWTAVPVAAEVIRRVAPLLGLRPEIEPAELTGITLTSN